MMLSHPAYALIESLDLAPVRARLTHPHAGPGWDEPRARSAEAQYREFLLVAKLFPNESPVPAVDVDTFWHFHILDTMKYARDCAHVFGHFLHHAPDTTARLDQPSAMRMAMTTNRVITMHARNAAANHDGYQVEEKAASYCAVTQRLSAGGQGYCAVTSSAPGSDDAALSYCAVADAVALSYCAVGASATPAQPGVTAYQ